MKTNLPGAALLSALSIGFFLGLISIDLAEQQFAAWVAKWSTLIAGLLAVVAAWWTVSTTLETDRRAHQRHEATRQLELRSDALRVSRAAFPLVRDLRAWATHAKAAAAEYTIDRGTKGILQPSVMSAGLDHLLQAEGLKQAMDLLDAKSHLVLQRLHEINAAVGPVVDQYQRALKIVEGGHIDKAREKADRLRMAVLEYFETTIAVVEDLAMKLERLDALYRPNRLSFEAD